jgi:hypothetical protein
LSLRYLHDLFETMGALESAAADGGPATCCSLRRVADFSKTCCDELA